jgi:hypothetical protein
MASPRVDRFCCGNPNGAPHAKMVRCTKNWLTPIPGLIILTMLHRTISAFVKFSADAHGAHQAFVARQHGQTAPTIVSQEIDP